VAAVTVRSNRKLTAPSNSGHDKEQWKNLTVMLKLIPLILLLILTMKIPWRINKFISINYTIVPKWSHQGILFNGNIFVTVVHNVYYILIDLLDNFFFFCLVYVCKYLYLKGINIIFIYI